MAIIDQYAAAERMISDMKKGSKDEQARARLVEIALLAARHWADNDVDPNERDSIRVSAGFKNPRTGSWCAAGLTAAMETAGLVVPAPGTPARRGAVALLDFVWAGDSGLSHDRMARWTNGDIEPGDIIAWLQHPPPDPAGWRRGHVALVVAVDDESITTVGWNEGNAPGRVMKRRLWRMLKCEPCDGTGGWMDAGKWQRCPDCKGKTRHKPSETVLYRRPGGLYGVARPVAR